MTVRVLIGIIVFVLGLGLLTPGCILITYFLREFHQGHRDPYDPSHLGLAVYGITVLPGAWLCVLGIRALLHRTTAHHGPSGAFRPIVLTLLWGIVGLVDGFYGSIFALQSLMVLRGDNPRYIDQGAMIGILGGPAGLCVGALFGGVWNLVMQRPRAQKTPQPRRGEIDD